METLRLLKRRYPVGTIVLEENDPWPRLTPEELTGEGYVLRDASCSDGDRFQVYQ